MVMEEQRLAYLLQQYRKGQITEDESLELKQMLNQGDGESAIAVLKEMLEKQERYTATEDKSVADAAFNRIISIDKTAGGKVKRPAARFLLRPVFRYAAAAIILLLGTGTYLYLQQGEKQVVVAVKRPSADILPGRDGAILKLADGSQIVLDSAGNGMLANEKGTEVLLNNGRLTYHAASTSEVSYNTMIIPKGRQFQVMLSDGSKVWLNAESSLRYPTVFKGKERKVEITGEAFLEVAPDNKQPFIVTTHGMEVQVLGTSFNINAYNDEAQIKTTLAEGSVKVISGSSSVMLTPGKQAVADKTSGLKVLNADVNSEIAWKQGYFKFEDDSIEDIMRQLSRWYNVEVRYEGKITERFFSTVSRNVPISQVLTLLERTGAVHFTTEGNRITVKP